MWKVDLRGRGYLGGDCTDAAPGNPPIGKDLVALSLAQQTPTRVEGNGTGREELLAWEYLPLSHDLPPIANGSLAHCSRRNPKLKSTLSRTVFPHQLLISPLSKDVKV